jgi:hypothetical protein
MTINLAKKYNYYLNESNRLNEELNTEIQYRQFLENVIVETLNEEQICELRDLLKKAGAAVVAGSCLLGAGGCGKHEAPKPAPVHAGVEGQLDLIQKPGAKQKQEAKPGAKQGAKPTTRIPGAGVEGEL